MLPWLKYILFRDKFFKYIEMYQNCQRFFEKIYQHQKINEKGLYVASIHFCTLLHIFITNNVFFSVLLEKKNQTVVKFTYLLFPMLIYIYIYIFWNKYLSSFNWCVKYLSNSTWHIRELIVPGLVINRGVTCMV